MELCFACSINRRELIDLPSCPKDKLTQIQQRDAGYWAYQFCTEHGLGMIVDKGSWEHCKREQLLEGCASECVDLSWQHPGLCVDRNAGFTLSLL